LKERKLDYEKREKDPNIRRDNYEYLRTSLILW